MAFWLERWIPNPGVPISKSLGRSKVDSAFHPSEVDKLVPRTLGDVVVKSGLSPRNVSVTLRQLNP